VAIARDAFSSALFGRTVIARKTKPASFTDPWAAVATYKGQRGTVAICRCDLSLAAYAGAGLSMIPSSRAEECVHSRELDANLLENLHEVMNVASRFFNRSGGRSSTANMIVVQGM
jgi:hypothetical protein